ncbi:MAG TPA: beta-ketoacyl synthase chain length factor [Bacteroidales bacterium]|nr:beta-ketoacyl synthase chain length factor [Bacteroidales bacterium]
MKLFINGTGNVSAQRGWDSISDPGGPAGYSGRMIRCPEPEADTGLDDKYIRRMSRMIRLGWIAARLCLDDAGNPVPDAIITGSGWGSVLDSEKFLLSIYKNNENLLPPTPFIQSTHNAVGAQVAMLLGNCSYNMTYAHGIFAFEHAMLDAMLCFMEGGKNNILLGGFDEITDNQFILTDRLGRWRKEPVQSLEMIDRKSKGTVAGEGYSFFFLQDHPSSTTYARLTGVRTIYRTDNKDDVSVAIIKFLDDHGLKPGDISCIFAGYNGDERGDLYYGDVLAGVFRKGVPEARWKHLTGDYLTAGAFATWAACQSIKAQTIPASLLSSGHPQAPIRYILIYNHFNCAHHSLILISHPDE